MAAASRTGDFIAFLSADDVWKNDKLALQHRALTKAPEQAGVRAHGTLPFARTDRRGGQAPGLPGGAHARIFAGPSLHGSTRFAPSGLRRKFRGRRVHGLVRSRRDLGVEITMLADTVSLRRVHPNNHSTRSLRRESYAPVLKALLDRRRSRASRRMSLIALLQARDEERFLSGWLENVAPAVDGIVALDDGSQDATAAILAAHPKTLEVICNPPGQAWNERGTKWR